MRDPDVHLAELSIIYLQRSAPGALCYDPVAVMNVNRHTTKRVGLRLGSENRIARQNGQA